jgi:hypothetical protein
MPYHRHRPLLDEWKHERSYAPVIIDQVCLGIPIARKQWTIRVRDIDPYDPRGSFDLDIDTA